MKKLLILLLLAVSFSCTKNNPEPDLTTDIIGVYSYTLKDQYGNYSYDLSITKIDKSHIRLLFSMDFKSNTKDIPDSFDSFIIDEVEMKDQALFNLENKKVDTSIISGYGQTSGNNLIISFTIIDDNDKDYFDAKFTRK